MKKFRCQHHRFCKFENGCRKQDYFTCEHTAKSRKEFGETEGFLMREALVEKFNSVNGGDRRTRRRL